MRKDVFVKALLGISCLFINENAQKLCVCEKLLPLIGFIKPMVDFLSSQSIHFALRAIYTVL